MSQRVDSTAPADTREQCYRLLTGKAPCRVVVDSDLPEGEWYVVRGKTRDERVADAIAAERYRIATDCKLEQAMGGASQKPRDVYP